MLAEGLASRFVQRASGALVASITSLMSMRVAQSEGDGDEHTRAGFRFIGNAVGATGIAPVQTIPSTAAHWLLWNPLGNINSLLIDEIAVTDVSGTAGAGGAFYGCLVGPSQGPTTIVTASAANVFVMNCNPVSAKASRALIASGQTLVNTAAGNWFPIGQMNPNGTLLAQTVMFQLPDVRGKYIVPPGCGLAIATISPTGTTPLFAPTFKWREYAVDLE